MCNRCWVKVIADKRGKASDSLTLDTPTELNCIWAVLPKTIRVPGNSEMEVMAKLGSVCQGETLYVEGGPCHTSHLYWLQLQ